MKLADVIQFTAGPNASRVKEQYKDAILYTVLDLEEDLLQKKGESHLPFPKGASSFTKQGDLVVSMMKRRAAIVTAANEGKLLNSNFVKGLWDEELADPWYLCYWLNESEDVKRQRQQCMVLSPYTAREMGELDIQLPPLPMQQKIGQLYQKMKTIEALLEKQKDAWQTMTLQTIKNVLKGD